MPLVFARYAGSLDFSAFLDADGSLQPPDPLWIRRQFAQTARDLSVELGCSTCRPSVAAYFCVARPALHRRSLTLHEQAIERRRPDCLELCSDTSTPISDRPSRQDGLVISVAVELLTLLGHAGESLGIDRTLRANTAKGRTHSLFRQGREYYRGAIGNLAKAEERLWKLFWDAFDH